MHLLNGELTQLLTPGSYVVIVCRAGGTRFWPKRTHQKTLLLLLIATRIFRASASSGLKSQNPVGKVAILFNFSSPIDFSFFSDPNSAQVLEEFGVHMLF